MTANHSIHPPHHAGQPTGHRPPASSPANTIRLRDADPTLRLFITAFLLVITAGYAVGIAFVDHTTSTTPSGIETRFLGSERAEDPDESGGSDGSSGSGEADGSGESGRPAESVEPSAADQTGSDMTFPKSPSEMFTLIHNHVFGLSILFFLLGGIFYFSSLVSPFQKRFLMLEPLVGIVTTFGGLALVRYISPAFSWLVILSGISVGLCYGAMILLILWELWVAPGRPA